MLDWDNTTTKITQYLIVFNDNSEIDLMVSPRIFYSKTDMLTGKNRNQFIRKIVMRVILFLLIVLKLNYK